MPLLTAGEAVEAGRVRLATLSDDAIGAMAWLESALTPEWSVEDLHAARNASEAVLIAGADGEPIGLAVLRAEYPGAADAAITFLAMQPERRFRGLGGEAGLAVEGLARERLGVHRVFVGVPEGRGLAVYFWLRLGFRPLSAVESPDARLGLGPESLPGIWMVRDAA